VIGRLIRFAGAVGLLASLTIPTASAEASAAASAAAPATRVQHFAGCRAMHQRFPHGVGRLRAHDRTSGMPVTDFRRSNRLYTANSGLDRDRDRIACEAPVRAPRIMVVGDSISQGSAGDYTWRYRLWQHLTSSHTSFVLVGPRNDLYDQNTQQQGSQDYVDRSFDTWHDAVWGRPIAAEKDTIGDEVAASRPDVLLVLLGINDLIYYDTPELAASDMATLIANARAVNPDIKIVVGQVLPHAPVASVPMLDTMISQFNTDLTNLAATTSTRRSPVVIASTATGFDLALDSYDGAHPNPAGEYSIAAAFADRLWTGFGFGAPFGVIPPAPSWPQTPVLAPAVAGAGSTTLTWSSVPGAMGYYVYQRDITAGQTAFTRSTFPVQATSVVWAPLVDGDHYEFMVASTKGTAVGAPSDIVGATPSATSMAQ